MNRYVTLRSTAWRRRALLYAFPGIVTAAGLLAAGPGFADVPPQSYTQKNPSNPPGATAVERLLAEAQKALKSGNARLAAIYLKNAISTAPRNGSVRMELGKVLFLAGDTQGAELELRQAGRDGAPSSALMPALFQVMLARDESQLLLDQFPEPAAGSSGPAAAEILKARALAHQKLKQPAEAIRAMDRSLELRSDVSGLLTRARLSLQQGDFATAGRIVDEAIQAWPDDPDAMLFKVEMLLMSRDNVGALNLASQARSKFPGSLPGRFARVEAFLRLNQDAKAKAEVENILAKNPGLIMANYYKALLMARAGHAKAAWGLAQTLPADFRDSDQGIAGMVAQMALSAGDTETGTAMLARMLKLDPSQVGVRVRLAGIRVQQGSPSTALNVLRPVLDSTDPRVISLLAVIQLQMHRPREALDALKKLDVGSGATAAVKRGIALLELQLGNPDEAVRVLTKAVAEEPANPIVVEPLIDILIQKRQLAEALAVAGRLGSDPKQSVVSLVYRGTILMLLRDFAGARAALDEAVVRSPGNTKALYARAALLVSLHKYDEANHDLNAILSWDDKDIAAILKLADIAARQGNDRNVRRLLGRAIALSPRDAEPRIAVLRYLISRRDMKAALAAANDCLRQQADNAECVLQLGRIQSALGQKKEALTSFRRYAYLRPQLPSAHVMLGAALSVAGDQAGAARAFNTAVGLAPQAPEAKRAQVNFQFGQGKADAALALARTFQASYPGSEADLLLADVFLRAKQTDKAAAVLNKSLIERPSDQRVRLEYAGILLQQGDNAQATIQYQTVLKQNADSTLALNNLGWLLQRDDPKRALALLTHAWALSPNSAAVADTLGWLKLQQKDVAAGLVLLDRAHALEPNDGEITYHLAVALNANSRRDAARGLLNALLASSVNFRDRPAATQLLAAWR